MSEPKQEVLEVVKIVLEQMATILPLKYLLVLLLEMLKQEKS